MRNRYTVDPYRFDRTHTAHIVSSIAVNPTFSARSCNPGGIPVLQNPKILNLKIREWKNRSEIAIHNILVQITVSWLFQV